MFCAVAVCLMVWAEADSAESARSTQTSVNLVVMVIPFRAKFTEDSLHRTSGGTSPPRLLLPSGGQRERSRFRNAAVRSRDIQGCVRVNTLRSDRERLAGGAGRDGHAGRHGCQRSIAAGEVDDGAPAGSGAAECHCANRIVAALYAGGIERQGGE